MEDKFVLKVHKIQTLGGNNRAIIRIDENAFNRVLELQRETGLSAKHIVSEMIRFASERVEIREITKEE